MRQLMIIMLLSSTGQCYGATYDLDTIENWQIYNGKNLLLAGHGSMGAHLQVTMKESELKVLEIQFNRCTLFIDEEVKIEITDENQKQILIKKFRINDGDRMTIQKKELGELTSEVLFIRFIECRDDGAAVELGKIKLE